MERQEAKELEKKEGNHDVQIALIGNELKHMNKSIDDLRGEVKDYSKNFLTKADFDQWKMQEYDKLEKTVLETHANILLKHTVSITRIMTYGTAIVSILGIIQIVITIISKL